MEGLVGTMEKIAAELERLAGELRSLATKLPQEIEAAVAAERARAAREERKHRLRALDLLAAEGAKEAAQTPPPPAAEPAPQASAPAPADAKGAVAGLGRISNAVGSLNYLVARADHAFVEQAPAILEKLSEEDVRGAKGVKFLYQLLCMVDSLAATYRSAKAQALKQACGQAASEIVPFIEERGFGIVPRPGETAEAAELKKTPVCSPLPEGVVVAVKKRALVKEGGAMEQGELLVSNGAWGAPQELLDSVAEAVMGGGASGNEGLDRARHKAWQELQSYLEGLAGADADKVHTLYRYAVNAVNRLPSGGPVKNAMGRLIDALREGGLREIPVPLGRKFDESFSPSRYERKRVKSDRAADTVVEVIQRGFVNEKGVPVQKAIVGVSGAR